MELPSAPRRLIQRQANGSHGCDDAHSEDGAIEVSAPTAASLAASRWRKSALQMMTRRNLLPWLAIKSVLTALVFSGQMTVWTAFVLDTIVSVAVIAYGWRFARRQAGTTPTSTR